MSNENGTLSPKEKLLDALIAALPEIELALGIGHVVNCGAESDNAFEEAFVMVRGLIEVAEEAGFKVERKAYAVDLTETADASCSP